ncbi:MAG: M15 family metallopeptidase [Flavobacteriales bacterium]|nr:M15 family metallopeptidase [Flavobacteriales bacterium]MCX7768202.1 M15 family metallopeptidase [Flavobacteriales bacterium]MDW8409153.1 M15 family metallopeptidase [Flavobacteriales bacterium]
MSRLIHTMWLVCTAWSFQGCQKEEKKLILPSTNMLGASCSRVLISEAERSKDKGPFSFNLDSVMQSFGLVDVQQEGLDVFVDLRYADSNNFAGRPLYVGLSRCYLHPLAASRLKKAVQMLAREYPGLRLLIWDCARPLSVQHSLWQGLKVPRLEKGKYVSNPRWGSVHNFGLAVDLTLADSLGRALDMGTDFDHFGPEAQPVMEENLRAQGLLSDSILKNRRILRRVMVASGFHPIPHEWWHFNAVSRQTALEKFKIIP